MGGARAVVVFHNHPSGDPDPESRRRGVDAAAEGGGQLMGIELVDHVILGDATVLSFKETGTGRL